jgi:hypothetical protein
MRRAHLVRALGTFACVVSCHAHGRADSDAGVTLVAARSADAGAAVSPSGTAAPAWDLSGSKGFTSIAPGASFYRAERKDGLGRNTAWLVVRLDLALVRLEVRKPRHERLENMANDADVAMAVNGGFFENDGSASGLLLSRGRFLGRLHPHAGSGVLFVEGGRASLVPTYRATEPATAELGLQCGPRLIEPGGAIGIVHDDRKRAARTAACIRKDGHELDVVVSFTRNSDRDGPGLLELAEWLAVPIAPGDESGCEAALNLDGGPSTGIVVRALPDETKRPFGRVPWALALVDGSSVPGAGAGL